MAIVTNGILHPTARCVGLDGLTPISDQAKEFDILLAIISGDILLAIISGDYVVLAHGRQIKLIHMHALLRTQGGTP